MSKIDKRKIGKKLIHFFSFVYLTHMLTSCAEAASLFHQVTQLHCPPHSDSEQRQKRSHCCTGKSVWIKPQELAGQVQGTGRIRVTINF